MIVDQTNNQHIIQPLVFSIGPKSNVTPTSSPAVPPVNQGEKGDGAKPQAPSTGQTPKPASSNAIDLTG